MGPRGPSGSSGSPVSFLFLQCLLEIHTVLCLNQFNLKMCTIITNNTFAASREVSVTSFFSRHFPYHFRRVLKDSLALQVNLASLALLWVFTSCNTLTFLLCRFYFLSKNSGTFLIETDLWSLNYYYIYIYIHDIYFILLMMILLSSGSHGSSWFRWSSWKERRWCESIFNFSLIEKCYSIWVYYPDNSF